MTASLSSHTTPAAALYTHALEQICAEYIGANSSSPIDAQARPDSGIADNITSPVPLQRYSNERRS